MTEPERTGSSGGPATVAHAPNVGGKEGQRSSTNDAGITISAPEGTAGGPARRKRHLSSSLAEIRRRAYSFDDLSRYTRKERFVIKAADLFLATLVRLIGMTIRWEAEGAPNLDSIYESGRRVVFVFWHESVLTSCWFWRGRGIVIMSSRSRDGEYTARFIKRFGYGTARGSSTRGSRRALVELSECLASGIDAAFTIDGPRGPAHIAKEGAVTLARHTECPILPFIIAVRRCIELPTWDRLQIPLPFTKAITIIGKPIWVPHNADQTEIGRKRSEMQAALDALGRRGQAWRRQGAK